MKKSFLMGHASTVVVVIVVNHVHPAHFKPISCHRGQQRADRRYEVHDEQNENLQLLMSAASAVSVCQQQSQIVFWISDGCEAQA